MLKDLFGNIYLTDVPLLFNVRFSVNLACSEVLAMTLSLSMRCLTCVSIFCSWDQSSASLIVMNSPVASFIAIFLAVYGPLFFGVDNSLTLASFLAYSLMVSTVSSGLQSSTTSSSMFCHDWESIDSIAILIPNSALKAGRITETFGSSYIFLFLSEGNVIRSS